MAYIDFNAAFAGATSVSSEALPAAERPLSAQFSPLEWTTIALARRDSLSSLQEPGRLSRALGSLFGLGTTSRLADPRLEALRRFAVHAWHRGYTLPVSEIKAFIAAGFSGDQLETILASTAQAQSQVQRRRFAA
jgi:hypothetical protein